MTVQLTMLKTRTTALRAARGDMRVEVAETGTVHRVLRVLAALAETNGGMSIRELAEQICLPFSTTQRLIHLLAKEGVVQSSASNHGYCVGPELLRIASRIVASVDIAEIAQEFLNRIAQRFGETAVLGLYLPTAPAVTFVAQADGVHALQYRLPMHQPLSLLRGASGKSILAFLPKNIVSLAWASELATPGAPALCPRSVVAQTLKRIRRDGYAVTEGERWPGTLAVAAPIFGTDGVLGCLCITAPKDRVSEPLVPTMARELLIEGNALSRILGMPEPQAMESKQ